MLKERDLRLALDVVLKGPESSVPKSRISRSVGPQIFARESLETQMSFKPLLQSKGVQAIGLGEKISKGRKTDQLSIRVYVDQKKPSSELETEVPRNLSIPAIGEVATDVIEIGKIKPESFRERIRPIQPGCGLGHVDESVGTFGSIVRKRNGDGQKFILSNSHVLAKSGLAQIGDAILQPGDFDDGRNPEDIIGQLQEFIPFDYTPSNVNLVDAAIASINPGIELDPDMRIIGSQPNGISTRLRRGMKVQKVGRTTDHTWGEIIDLDATPIIPYPDPNDPDSDIPVFFRDQVLCTRYTAGGDSGSEVRTELNNVVGLHFAGSESTSLFNKISNVFDALDIELDI